VERSQLETAREQWPKGDGRLQYRRYSCWRPIRSEEDRDSQSARTKVLKVAGGAGVDSIAGVMVYPGWWYGLKRGENSPSERSVV
jgi:hypothetical protein